MGSEAQEDFMLKINLKNRMYEHPYWTCQRNLTKSNNVDNDRAIMYARESAEVARRIDVLVKQQTRQIILNSKK